MTGVASLHSYELFLPRKPADGKAIPMNETAPSYRFAQVAKAIGVTEPGLRNWMTRNKLDLFEGRPERGWRSFSENDVFVLALAAELVRFGAPVEDAVDAVRGGLAEVNFRTWEGLPTHLYASPCRFGGWRAYKDEAFATGMSSSGSVLKVPVPIILVAARKTLAGAE